VDELKLTDVCSLLNNFFTRLLTVLKEYSYYEYSLWTDSWFCPYLLH